jgi:opacity protein-like surface antigen
MNFRKMLVLAVALVIAASPLSAFQAKPADVTGTWTGTLTTGAGQAGPAHMELKQKGAELTGTAGPGPEGQLPIANGKVTTVKDVTGVTFEVNQKNGAVMKFDLKVADGRLKGNVTLERDGQKQQGTIDVGREK